MITLLAVLACFACLVGAGLVEARVIKVDREPEPVPTVGRHRPEVDRAVLVADLTAFLAEPWLPTHASDARYPRLWVAEITRLDLDGRFAPCV